MFATGCLFTVNHKDGIEDNPFRLVITGSYNESDLFEFNEIVASAERYQRVYELM